jgi:hypothetical protein
MPLADWVSGVAPDALAGVLVEQLLGQLFSSKLTEEPSQRPFAALQLSRFAVPLMQKSCSRCRASLWASAMLQGVFEPRLFSCSAPG